MTYTLYASGSLIDNSNPAEAMQATPILAKAALRQVGPRCAEEEPRKIKSANSLRELIMLQHKLKTVGFDVYIERA